MLDLADLYRTEIFITPKGDKYFCSIKLLDKSVAQSISTSRKSIAEVWEINRKRQMLMMPRGFHIIDPSSSLSAGRRTMGFFRRRGEPIVWVLCERSDSLNNYEEITVFLFRHQDKNWVVDNKNIDLTFSHRGGFFMKKQFLYIWDWDDQVGHMDPSRYRVSCFEVNTKLVNKWSKITKKRYLPMRGKDQIWPLPEHVLPKDDPLREFGLKWTWWDTPAVVGRAAPLRKAS